MLRVESICAGYDGTEVLFDLSLTVKAGEFVTLLGRNGMGKTTTVRTIMGLLAAEKGDIAFGDKSILKWEPYRIARSGIGLVPEGRAICSNLTVLENLNIAARPTSNGWNLDDVTRLFPVLKTRSRHYGNQLSGGEQQLLAIGRALLSNPRLLILDEATEGLAPLMRAEVWNCLNVLRSRGQAVLIIDKHIKKLSEIADKHYVLEKGRVVWTGDAALFRRERSLLDRYLGV